MQHRWVEDIPHAEAAGRLLDQCLIGFLEREDVGLAQARLPLEEVEHGPGPSHELHVVGRDMEAAAPGPSHVPAVGGERETRAPGSP